MMLIHEDVEQRSDEWYQLRLGKPTASSFKKCVTNSTGSISKSIKEYAERLALDEYLGTIDDTSHFDNKYMQRGRELEVYAYEKLFK